MTTKEWLRQVRTIDRRVDSTIERLERMRARLEAGRMSNISGMPRGGAIDWTVTADMVIDLEKRLNAEIREMCRTKQAALDAIDAVEEANLREVLELYYLDGYTWDQVAQTMGYDRRHVTRLHGIALGKIHPPECP